MRYSLACSWAHCLLGLQLRLGLGRRELVSGTKLIGYAECAGKSVGRAWCGVVPANLQMVALRHP